MYRASRPSGLSQRLQQADRKLSRRSNKRIAALLILSAAIITIAVGTMLILGNRSDGPHHSTTPSTNKHASTSNTDMAAPSSQFNTKQYSLTDPGSIWIVVNKQRPLSPKTYAPNNLVVPAIPLRANITSTEKYVRADMAKALEKMVNDAATQGVHFNLQSGYRSYNFQVSLYNGYVQSQGQAVADRQSARPGYSEHQTGLAADLGGTSRPACDIEACYTDTTEGIWLAANAYKYGFLVRYPADKEPVTGYLYEPWHIRYIGTALAGEMHSKSIETLEEFFSVSGGTTYR